MLGDSGRCQIILTILNWAKSCLTTASFGHVKRSPYNHQNIARRTKQAMVKKNARKRLLYLFLKKNKTKQIVSDAIVSFRCKRASERRDVRLSGVEAQERRDVRRTDHWLVSVKAYLQSQPRSSNSGFEPYQLPPVLFRFDVYWPLPERVAGAVCSRLRYAEF